MPHPHHHHPQHPTTPFGRTVMWSLILLGFVVIALMFTKGFGIFASNAAPTAEIPLMVKKGDNVELPDGSLLRPRIVVEAVKAEQIAPKLVLPAMVEVDPARNAAVLSPLSGRLTELKVHLGDRVTEGQALAVIESPDVAQAYDDYEKALDAKTLSEKNLRRQEEQLKLGTASARDLDQAKSDYAQAEAEYGRTVSRLHAIGMAPEQLREQRAIIVRAPVSGSVTSLSVAAHNMINDPTQPLMTISDLSVVWVTAQVPEKDIGAISDNQDADIVLESFPDKTLHGTVAFVSDVVEPDSRRNKIRIAVKNPDRALKANMFATVTLAGAKESRITVPTTALLMNNDRVSVFVETAPWNFVRRPLELQLEEGDRVAVKSGLKDGEKIVVKGGILIND